MNLLVQNFNPHSVEGLMCRNTVNVAWSGHVFDCDFNQTLEMPPEWEFEGKRSYSVDGDVQCPHDGPSVFDLEDLNQFMDSKIATDAHCYACTAGAGSKCGT